VEVADLNAITERIAEIAAKRWDQLDSVRMRELIAHFGELFVVANHDSEVPRPIRLSIGHLEHGEKLMFAEFEERISLASGNRSRLKTS